MEMDSFVCRTLVTSIVICMALQHGCGHPLSERAALRAQDPRSQHVRTKRCSCNSWDDKECIYFCHLDIIWVNTPSKLLPYGLGSPPSRRRRRSAGRCKCSSSSDKTCAGFCRDSSQNPSTEVLGSPGKSGNKHGDTLLQSYRSVVKSNAAIAKRVLSSNKGPALVETLRGRTRR